MSNQRRIRIELTSAQKEQIKQASGRDCDTMELTVNELEQRVAPSLSQVAHRAFTTLR